MPYELTSLNALRTAPFDTIIDVRAPSEFAEDHIPGAINLPVLDDAERARVGTIYKQESPFKARKIGAALVSRNAARHLDGPLAEKEGGWQPLVYCWRGGQRSGSFASILAQIGWRTKTLAGGYKSYRQKVVSSLYETAPPSPVILLDGNTGTGKSELLELLKTRGIQTIDLEALANHRGSALGGQGDQPSQKMFESKLAAIVSDLDPSRAVVVEAESSKIGRLNLPGAFFNAMRDAPRISIAAPVEARISFLIDAYSDVLSEPASLMDRLDLLVPLRGRAQVDDWKKCVATGDFAKVARGLIELHYDPRYEKSRKANTAKTKRQFTTERLDETGLEKLADQVAEAVNEF
ncbi:MAG: tRNA 2-selenouridine(34) synthase MnmH [Boseongicola sp.]|nr:tRNA 2-selenouridine(34) synthase MnmH [Boseongicola sp.]